MAYVMVNISTIGSGIIFIILFLSLAFLVFNIVSSIWAYRDAKQKGYSSEFAAVILIATLFFPIIGLVIYLVIRNDQYK
jgi:hypothetical protein